MSLPATPLQKYVFTIIDIYQMDEKHKVFFTLEDYFNDTLVMTMIL